MLVYVTSLYSVREDYLPTLYHHFQQLLPLISNPVYVFTDRAIPFTVPANVHIIRYNLDQFDTYCKCMDAYSCGQVRLPNARNEQKDTAEFMALMNTKAEMVWRASAHFPLEATHVAWIDAGIMKIVKHKKTANAAFAAHLCTQWPPQSVTLPGCWPSLAPPSSDAICWRFCGGFIVIPTVLMSPFYEAVTSVLDAWLHAGYLVWEVNIWAALEWDNKGWFNWWGADHNETMLEPPGFLELMTGAE